MKILAIDTSTPLGSVALTDGKDLAAEECYHAKSTHAEVLLQTIDCVIKKAGRQIGDIDGIAVAIGPGSFTGIRIGLATAKGLAFALDKPLVGVSSLKALALNIPSHHRTIRPSHQIIPCIDAHRSEVYTAIYRSPSALLLHECAISPANLANELLKHKGNCIFSGDGAIKYADVFKSLLGKRFVLAEGETSPPCASNVARLALSKFKDGKIADLASITPNYIRKSAAELKKGSFLNKLHETV